ncbi:MAG: hypothetical protein AAF621_00415 [Pseudomonadota bacterium]
MLIIEDNPENSKAASAIQRAVRLKNKYKGHRDKVRDWPNPSPVVTSPPPRPERDEVLSEVPEELRKYYHLVSHDSFIAHLRLSFSMALKEIGSRPYTYMYISNMLGDEIARKSEHWVVGELLKEDIRFQPKPPPEQGFRSRLIEEPSAKDILIFDDASYSGEQLFSSLAYRVLKDKKLEECNLHIVVPFMSDDAKNMIGEAQKVNTSIALKIHSSAQIMHISERMPPELQKSAKETKLEYLTVFAHKQADETSLGDAAKYENGSIADYKHPSTRQDFKDYWDKTRGK